MSPTLHHDVAKEFDVSRSEGRLFIDRLKLAIKISYWELAAMPPWSIRHCIRQLIERSKSVFDKIQDRRTIQEPVGGGGR